MPVNNPDPRQGNGIITNPDGTLSFQGSTVPLSSVTASYLGLTPGANNTYTNSQGQTAGYQNSGYNPADPTTWGHTNPLARQPGQGPNIYGPPPPSLIGRAPGQGPNITQPGAAPNTGGYSGKVKTTPTTPAATTAGVNNPLARNTGSGPAYTPPPSNNNTNTNNNTNNTQGVNITIPGTEGTPAGQYAVPAGSDPNKLYGLYGGPGSILDVNSGNYLDANGNPTTDSNWLNSQNMPDWLKSQFVWNPGDQSIGGGTPGHWEFKYTDQFGMKDANGNTIYPVGDMMADPGKYFRDPSKIYYDPNMGWVTQDKNAVLWNLKQSSWHRGDYISAGSIILGGLASGMFPQGWTGGFDPSGLTAAPSVGGPTGEFAGTTLSGGNPFTAGGPGSFSGGIPPTTGTSNVVTGPTVPTGATDPNLPAASTHVTVTPGGGGLPPAVGTPTPPPTTTTIPGNTNTPNTNTPDTNTPNTTNNNTPPAPNGADQGLWNNVVKIWNGLSGAAKIFGSITGLYNFMAMLTGGHPLSFGNTTPGGNGPGSGPGNGPGGLNPLAFGASWAMNNNLIQQYQHMMDQYFKQGDFNAQYRPGQLDQLNQLLTDPAKYLQNDSGYQRLRDQELGNEDRMLNAKGFNISGNEMGDLLKYGNNLDYQHINDIAKNLTSAANLGDPSGLAQSEIRGLPFLMGMMANRNQDILNGASQLTQGASSAIGKLADWLKGQGSDINWKDLPQDIRDQLTGAGIPDPVTDPQNYAEWSKSVFGNYASMPDPATDPYGYAQWLENNMGGAQSSGFTPPDGFSSWDDWLASLFGDQATAP